MGIFRKLFETAKEFVYRTKKNHDKIEAVRVLDKQKVMVRSRRAIKNLRAASKGVRINRNHRSKTPGGKPVFPGNRRPFSLGHYPPGATIQYADGTTYRVSPNAECVRTSLKLGELKEIRNAKRKMEAKRTSRIPVVRIDEPVSSSTG